jgi:cardiolipin synthase A/B
MNWQLWGHEGWEFLVAGFTLLGYLCTYGLVPVVLLKKKEWPASTVAWVMAIIMLPYIGALLFLVFGINRVEQRVRRRRAERVAVRRWVPSPASMHAVLPGSLQGTQRQLARVAEQLGGTKPVAGNRVTLFSHTPSAFSAIEDALQRARETIHLEYYIWQPDRIGTRLRDLLIERARSGVRIRFLYDALGSLRLSAGFFKPMRDVGIAVAPFVPGRSLRERWSINLRSHRKLVLIDGQTGFTGGMNVGDEYLGRSPHFGYWRDTFLKIDGPAVASLQEVFATDWFSATSEELFDRRSFPELQDVGRHEAQILSGGPDDEQSVFHGVTFAAINAAQFEINLATSYFVPTPALVMALCSAALRGVRTRVLVSGPVTYWHTYHAARSFFDELLQAGVQIFEYQRGQQHAKTLSVDGQWALVGSANCDARSMFLNFEVGVALFDSSLVEQLDHAFNQDLRDSQRIDRSTWRQRPMIEHLKESWCRLFSPVL